MPTELNRTSIHFSCDCMINRDGKEMGRRRKQKYHSETTQMVKGKSNANIRNLPI